MKRSIWFIALLHAWIGAAGAAEWRVVLLKPRDCTSCIFVEEMLKRGSQLRQAVLEDGAGGAGDGHHTSAAPPPSFPRRNGRSFPPCPGSTSRCGDGSDHAPARPRCCSSAMAWSYQGATSPIRPTCMRARFPDDSHHAEPGAATCGKRNEARTIYATDLFRRSWNLSWFYRLALDPSIYRARFGGNWISPAPETLAPPLGTANVLLMSTASGAADNEIFNALRIEEIRDVLTQSLALRPDSSCAIFYGGGNSLGANALEVRGGRIGLVRRNVADAHPFAPDAVMRIFQSIHARPGQPQPAGADRARQSGRRWHVGQPLAACRRPRCATLHEHGGGDDVLVSGNCFGGVMARATSCGFFGARPDIVATGCQADCRRGGAEPGLPAHVLLQPHAGAPARRRMPTATA